MYRSTNILNTLSLNQLAHCQQNQDWTVPDLNSSGVTFFTLRFGRKMR